MNRIPPEHPAAKSLEHAFRSLGTERAREQQRARRRSGRAWRIVVAALAPVFAVAAVATGTRVFTGDGGALRPDPKGNRDPRRGYDLTPTGRAPAVATAPDPSGGPRWGVRVYRADGGRTCVSVGRVVGGRLGVVRQGQFKETPPGYPGLCDVADKAHVIVGWRTYPTAGGRAALYGVVDRTVQRLQLLTQTGRPTAIPIASDGTFVLVRPGAASLRHGRLVADGTFGRKVTTVDPS